MIENLRKLLAPLRTRIANMVARSVVQLADDSKKLQSVQLGVLAGETREGVERFQNYGFSSVPLDGAEAVVLFVGGSRDHGLAIAVDDRRYRIRNLESGEVAVYTDQGDSIVLKRDGNIEVTASTKVVVNSPLVELAGNPEAVVKGTTYRAAEATMNAALGAQLIVAGTDPTLLGLAPLAAAALNTAGIAVQTFEAASSTYLSTKVKIG